MILPEVRKRYYLFTKKCRDKRRLKKDENQLNETR